MASPITFSGFNDIDFNLILNAVMQQASQPLTALQSRQSNVESQIKTFGTFTAQALSLRDAAADLADADGVATLKATSSHTAIATASVSSDAAAGHFDVVVTALARAQVTVSTSTAPDSNTTIVASGGTITIGGADVAIGGDVTLRGLAEVINETEGIGVTAAVLRTGTDTYRLTLTSRETGLDHAFAVVNGLTGGTGVTLGGNAVEASDAALLVNNVAVTGSTNTFEDVITGVTLSIAQADPDTTVSIDVASDGADLEGKVEAFIAAYNGFVEFQTTQRTSAAEGSLGSIGNTPLLRGLRSSLRAELSSAHGSGVYTRLSEVGVEFTATGTLQLNKAAFTEALAADGDAVRDLFAGANGVFAQVEAQVVEYTQADGFIATATDGLRRQVDSMADQIIDMQARLAQQRESLLREFIEADLAMSRLKNQATSLAQFGTGLGTV